MDAFTLNLLQSNKVIAVSEDLLGDQAVTMSQDGDARVCAKKLGDSSQAVGFFNTGTNGTFSATVKWRDLHIHGYHTVRDLWRQRELGGFRSNFHCPWPRTGGVGKNHPLNWFLCKHHSPGIKVEAGINL
jgi:alpha-galactosidase